MPPLFFAMIFPRSLVTAPTAEPISLMQAFEHLQNPPEEDSGIIDGMISAARVHIENVTGRALMTQTWDVYPPNFCGDAISLPLGKLQSVTYIKYTDTAGTQTTVTASDYHVDAISEPGKIVLAYGASWPSTTLKTSNPIVVRGVFGYASASLVPAPLKHAMLLLLGHYYSNREPVVVSDRAGAREVEMPHTVQALIAPYQLWQ